MSKVAFLTDHDIYLASRWRDYPLRLFQVQNVHFDEMKGPTIGPLFCEIEAFNLKTFRFQFRKHLEKVPNFNLIYNRFFWYGY